MEFLQHIQGVDIYLIDQILKQRIPPGDRVLDAGCGTGRNLRFFIQQGFDVIGIDPEVIHIQSLSAIFPEHQDKLIVSTIEDYQDPSGFDFIVCNAVLHFSRDHDHFNEQFSKLVSLLRPHGILFIRMTSDIGIDLSKSSSTGVYQIPDKSTRYLITREQIKTLSQQHNLSLLDPVKSTVVDDVRSMTTLVFQKQD